MSNFDIEIHLRNGAKKKENNLIRNGYAAPSIWEKDTKIHNVGGIFSVNFSLRICLEVLEETEKQRSYPRVHG